MRRIMLFVVAGVLGCGGGGGGGGGGDGGTTNHAPSVKVDAGPSPIIMGQTTQLSTQATDQDNDTLTYSWAQTAPASPQGTFSSLTSANEAWTAPTVSAATRFTLLVTVSDGHGGTGTGPATAYAKTSTDPSFLADVQPFLVGCFGSCHTAPTGRQPLAEYATLVNTPAEVECPGELRVKPGDPDNSVLYKTMSGASCGNQMPPTPPYSGTDDLDSIRTWISQGALNN